MTSADMTSAAVQNPEFQPAQPPKGRQFKFLRVTFALMMREIASTDTRTSAGFLWQLAEPVATIAIMTLIFQMMARTPPLGTNYPLFYVTGLFPFSVFQTVSNKVSSCVRFSRPLLEFPSVSVIDALAARFLLNFAIECIVFLFLIVVIVWFWDLRITVDIPRAAEAILLAGMLALGIGAFNSVLFLAFPAYEMAWDVITRPLLLISGVIFLVTELPKSMAVWVMWNPVAHPIILMRSAFYPGVDISQVSPFYIVMISLVTFTFGLVTLIRMFRDALER